MLKIDELVAKFDKDYNGYFHIEKDDNSDTYTVYFGKGRYSYNDAIVYGKPGNWDTGISDDGFGIDGNSKYYNYVNCPFEDLVFSNEDEQFIADLEIPLKIMINYTDTDIKFNNGDKLNLKQLREKQMNDDKNFNFEIELDLGDNVKSLNSQIKRIVGDEDLCYNDGYFELN